MSYCPGAVNILRGRSLTSWGGVITRENGYWATIEDKGAGYEFTTQCPHLCGHCAATENREQYFPFSQYLSYSPLGAILTNARSPDAILCNQTCGKTPTIVIVLTLQPQLTHTKVVTPTIAPRADIRLMSDISMFSISFTSSLSMCFSTRIIHSRLCDLQIATTQLPHKDPMRPLGQKQKSGHSLEYPHTLSKINRLLCAL